MATEVGRARIRDALYPDVLASSLRATEKEEEETEELELKGVFPDSLDICCGLPWHHYCSIVESLYLKRNLPCFHGASVEVVKVFLYRYASADESLLP